MNNIIEIQNVVKQMKNNSQQLRAITSSFGEEKDISLKFFISNLKKMSLQSLDLSFAIEKQISLLQNQKQIVSRRQQQKGKIK